MHDTPLQKRLQLQRDQATDRRVVHFREWKILDAEQIERYVTPTARKQLLTKVKDDGGSAVTMIDEEDEDEDYDDEDAGDGEWTSNSKAHKSTTSKKRKHDDNDQDDNDYHHSGKGMSSRKCKR